MKKILIVSPEIPFPVFKGNQNRIDLTIRAFIDLGYSVSLVCLNSSQGERQSSIARQDVKDNYPGIDRVEIRRHPKFSAGLKGRLYGIEKTIATKFGKSSFSNIENCPRNFIKTCGDLISDIQPDYVFVNYIKLSECIPETYSGIKIVDLHDIQSNIYKESIKQKGGILSLDGYLSCLDEEIRLIDSYDKVISINANESRYLSNIISSEKVYTLPAFSEEQHVSNRQHVYDVMFVGSASPFNVEGIMKFIAKVMPKVKKAIPDIKVAIAGDVSTCSAVRKVKDDVYTKLGRVDSLTELYSSSSVVVSPIVSGAGMKVKNIEALSYGMPIVATSFSMDGINVKHNDSALLADDWDGFAKALIDLLRSDSVRKSISDGAKNYFKDNHSFDAAKVKLHSILQSETSNESSKSSAIISSVANNQLNQANYKGERTKALIFSTDAYQLISLNLFLAKEMEKLGIYSEFVRMENHGEHHFLSEGFLVHSLKGRMSGSRRSEFKKQYSNCIAEDGEIGCVLVHGVDISEDLRVYKKMFPAHFDKPISDVIAHGVLIVEALIKLIEKINPHFLVGWNGNGPHMVFLMKVAAKIKEIPIYHVERGLLPNSIVFDSNGVNFKSIYAGSYLPLINEVERRKAEFFIEKYRRQSKTIVTNENQLILNSNSIGEKFNVNNGYIFFPMQIEGDSNIILNSPIYKKMADVLRDLKWVAEKLDVKVICRPHPENKDSLESILEEFTDCESVIIDSEVELHSMIKASIATVVINSTVGLESLLHGVPTISLGCSFYSHKGLTYDCASRENVEVVIGKILGGAYNLSVQHEKLQRLVSLLISEYLLFLDGDVAGYSNAAKIEKMLVKNSIISNKKMGVPGKPKKVVDYYARKASFTSFLEGKVSVRVENNLEEGTVRYLNGSKKPVVTGEMIVSELAEIFNKEVRIVNGGESDISLINAAKGLSSKDTAFQVDEYLELI